MAWKCKFPVLAVDRNHGYNPNLFKIGSKFLTIMIQLIKIVMNPKIVHIIFNPKMGAKYAYEDRTDL